MEQRMLDWLKEDIAKVDQKVDKLDTELNDKLDLMATDITSMLEFKWQIVGGSVVISAIVGVVIQIVLAISN
jgi:hypothetical protein